MHVWLPCNHPFFPSKNIFSANHRIEVCQSSTPEAWNEGKLLQATLFRDVKKTTTRPWPLWFLREFWGSPWLDETPSLALAMFAGAQDEDLRSLILCKSNRQLWQMQRISVQLKCQTPVMCCIRGKKKEWVAAAKNLEERLMHSLKNVSYSYTNSCCIIILSDIYIREHTQGRRMGASKWS